MITINIYLNSYFSGKCDSNCTVWSLWRLYRVAKHCIEIFAQPWYLHQNLIMLSTYLSSYNSSKKWYKYFILFEYDIFPIVLISFRLCIIFYLLISRIRDLTLLRDGFDPQSQLISSRGTELNTIDVITLKYTK